MERVASCCCGQLTLRCEGEPVRISVCHCLECQRRTGSAFGVQARYPDSAVSEDGTAAEYTRGSDSGGKAKFFFCPICGTTVYWRAEALADYVTVAVGAFADPKFPPPTVSVYEERKHTWVTLPDSVHHID